MDTSASTERPRFESAIPTALFALTTLLAAACGDGVSTEGWTAEVDTLSSGAVRVVNHPPEAAGADWTLEEELRIGAVEGEGAATFGQVKGLAVTGDGRIAVLDAQAREVRVFAPDGTHLATHGRQGEGPGELEGGYGLMLGPEGRFWVPDHQLDRMTVFDPDSGFVDAWDFPILLFGFIWNGIVTDEGTVWKRSLAMSGNRDPLLRVYGRDMTLLDTLPAGTRPRASGGDPPGAFRWRAPDGRSGGAIGVPWYPAAKTALDPAGAIWSTDRGNPGYRIKRWVPGGDTTLVIETRRAPVPVPETARDSAIDAIREHLVERGADASRDWSKIPHVKPAVRSLFVADDGRLWVRTPSPRGESRVRFDVYGRDGRLAGTLVTGLLSAERNPQAVPTPTVRGDRIWMVVTDELGVDYVVRARIVDVREVDAS